ncbi:MAG: rSAM/selenodomain-associated transferase 2 [Candidatus Azotimanducaceae bacterium]|jgi:rSAM/selenodomain-associated transferase 2
MTANSPSAFQSLSEPAEMRISIVVPVLNDAALLGRLLPELEKFQAEVIVVDGGSGDAPELVADRYGAHLVQSEPGRAKQMNAGARVATGDILLFLHADSQLPAHFDALIRGGMRGPRFSWGRFDVRLSGAHPMFRMIEWMMNIRSRHTGICTGDQGIFIKTEYFTHCGGFPDIPLMEDIAFSKRMLRAPYCIRQRLTTSSRRWEQNGIFKTMLLMWSLRLRYFFGAAPEDLVKRYYG